MPTTITLDGHEIRIKDEGWRIAVYSPVECFWLPTEHAYYDETMDEVIEIVKNYKRCF